MENSNLLRAVVLVSEKAANIARAIRKEEHLLSLLVQEKKDEEKNPRFAHDFKTLADVLVQEVVKHDLGKEFKDLIGHIYGEESNEFSCPDGESVYLRVGSCESETSSQLLRILGDERAAQSLAQLVHSSVEVDMDIPECHLSTENLGLWIDPIDSTAEYIAGGAAESDVAGVYLSGLPCVTVLIGAFNRLSGQPVLGVVNQPFSQQEGLRWTGNIVWGVCSDNKVLSSIPKSVSSEDKKVVVLSSSESELVKSRLTSAGFSIVEAAGAGYKLLCVARGCVQAYILSKPSTFYWDTCGVHAVLLACGGGLVSYMSALQGASEALTYAGGTGTEQCCNAQGLIAYTNPQVLQEVIGFLRPQ